MTGEKNGETLKLFQDYDSAPNETSREELLDKIVARVLSILLEQKTPNGRFSQLIEAHRQYPNAFENMTIVVCRSLEIPAGLRSLLVLYSQTRNWVLRDRLLAVREEAFRTDEWGVLETFADTGLMREFAQLAQKQRTIK